MKRMTIFAGILAAALLLGSCGEDYVAVVEYVPAVDDVYYEEEYIPAAVAEVTAEAATAADFLADLDYLMYALENNFPFFYTVYWARGVDIHALAADARAAILAADSPDADVFLYILHESFAPLFRMGHFSIFGPFGHYLWLHGYSAGTIDGSEVFRSFLAQDHVMAFYGPRMEDFSAEAAETAVNDISFDSIEPGRIAYMHIPRMRDPDDPAAVTDFFTAIAGYDHLIIDIRGNPGGNNWFEQQIIRPNITQAVSANLVVFHMNGSLMQFPDGPFFRAGLIGSPQGDVFTPAADFLAENPLPYANQADLDRMAYGFSARVSILPATRGYAAFNGEIWLLIDGATGSAAQIAAWLAKDIGFATLVGEVSGGNYGGFRTYSAMPGTGIVFIFDGFYIADTAGRPLEAGTIPHYFNFDGMDALETTLELIAR